MSRFQTSEPEPWPSAEEDVCPTCGYSDPEWKGETACTDKFHNFRDKKLSLRKKSDMESL